jgi:hypothetical protein
VVPAAICFKGRVSLPAIIALIPSLATKEEGISALLAGVDFALIALPVWYTGAAACHSEQCQNKLAEMTIVFLKSIRSKTRCNLLSVNMPWHQNYPKNQNYWLFSYIIDIVYFEASSASFVYTTTSYTGCLSRQLRTCTFQSVFDHARLPRANTTADANLKRLV